MFTRRIVMLALAVVMGTTVSACRIDVERNPDGSWQVTANITEAEMQAEIDNALADPLVSNVKADFHAGYVTVTADRMTLDGSQTQLLSFQADLSVVDGHLGIVISDAQLGGQPIEQAVVSTWNARLANNLERAGKKNPRSTLQSVTVTDNDLTMEWRVEKKN